MVNSNSILLIGEASSAFDDLYTGIKSQYNLVKVELGTADIETFIKNHIPNLIVVYIEEFVKWKLFPLKNCVEDIVVNNIPIIAVLKREDEEGLCGYLPGIHLEMEFIPFTTKRIVDKVGDVLNGKGLKAETEVHRRKIVVCDNDKDSINIIAKTLGPKYDVYFSPSIGDAFIIIGRNGADLIIFNYSMEECEGLVAIKMFRASNTTKDIPLICMEDADSSYKVQECMSLNPAACLLRPINGDDIEKAVRNALKK